MGMSGGEATVPSTQGRRRHTGLSITESCLGAVQEAKTNPHREEEEGHEAAGLWAGQPVGRAAYGQGR